MDRGRLGNGALLRKGSVSFILPANGVPRQKMHGLYNCQKSRPQRTPLKTYCVESQRVHTSQAHGALKTSRFRLRQLARTTTYLHTLHQKRTHYVAHPRERGEHSHRRSFGSGLSGSSPRARGARDGVSSGFARNGPIPARAGSTCNPSRQRVGRRAHPRMRREHVLSRSSCQWMKGSSPHARGTLVVGSVLVRKRGLIPACAGNTLCVRVGAHPRMRGEHMLGLSDDPAIRGSSPHARGTQIIAAFNRGKIGLIPACAGNTVIVW